MPDAKPRDVEGGTLGIGEWCLEHAMPLPQLFPLKDTSSRGWDGEKVPCGVQAPVLGAHSPRVLTHCQALQLIPSPGLIPRGSISSSASRSWEGQRIVFNEGRGLFSMRLCLAGALPGVGSALHPPCGQGHCPCAPRLARHLEVGTQQVWGESAEVVG